MSQHVVDAGRSVRARPQRRQLLSFRGKVLLAAGAGCIAFWAAAIALIGAAMRP